MSSGIDKGSKPAAKRSGRKRPSAVDVLAKTDAAAKQKSETPKRERRTKDQVQVDRRKIITMMRRGATRPEMAAACGITLTRLYDEIEAIRKEWASEGGADLDTLRREQEERLREVIAEAWRGWEQSKRPSSKATTETRKEGQRREESGELVAVGEPLLIIAKSEIASQGAVVTDGVEQTGKGNPGDPRFLKTIIDANAQIAVLRGLNAPTKVAPTTPDGEEPYTPGASIDDFAAVLAAAQEYEKTRAAQEQFERLATGKANAATSGS